MDGVTCRTGMVLRTSQMCSDLFDLSECEDLGVMFLQASKPPSKRILQQNVDIRLTLMFQL